jgi:hypothetical protein
MKSTLLVTILALAACGGDSKPAKGGGKKGTSAMGTGQMAGGTAAGKKNMSTMQGQSYEGVTCDSSTQDLAWCDDDFDIAFCDGGQWYLLDCSAFDAFCGDDGLTVDCYQ